MTITRPAHLTRLGGVAAAAAIVFIVTVVAAPATAGECYRAAVSQAISLPDGSIHAPGSITVCRVRQISPVSVLHSLTVNDRDQGFFIGTRRSVEAEGASRPTFIFSRDGSEALELRAVAYDSGGQFVAYRTDRIGRGTHPRVRTRGSFDLARRVDNGGEGGLVLIAAAD